LSSVFSTFVCLIVLLSLACRTRVAHRLRPVGFQSAPLVSCPSVQSVSSVDSFSLSLLTPTATSPGGPSLAVRLCFAVDGGLWTVDGLRRVPRRLRCSVALRCTAAEGRSTNDTVNGGFRCGPRTADDSGVDRGQVKEQIHPNFDGEANRGAVSGGHVLLMSHFGRRV
jgi:hypothetical protein